MQQGVILSYLRDSHRSGVKEANTILPCGLTAGEAAVLYFRQMNQKQSVERTVETPVKPDNEYYQKTVTSLLEHMGVDVRAPHLSTLFECHFNHSFFENKNWKKNFQMTLKTFLGAANMRSKGYTAKLKLVVMHVTQ